VRVKRRPKILLPDDVFEPLSHRAAIMVVSTAKLVVELLREIARDGLYDAVLDRDDMKTNCVVTKRAAHEIPTQAF
jgi:hypothetical protein